MKFVMCPECEAGFKETDLRDGKLPPHRWLGQPCPGGEDDRPKFYLCGGCDHLHPFGWTGDCRDNSQRFTHDQVDARWPHWIEVDEATGEEV